MGQAHPHRGLELRLEVLRNRIRTLKGKMDRAEGVQKIEALGVIACWKDGTRSSKTAWTSLTARAPGSGTA